MLIKKTPPLFPHYDGSVCFWEDKDFLVSFCHSVLMELFQIPLCRYIYGVACTDDKPGYRLLVEDAWMGACGDAFINDSICITSNTYEFMPRVPFWFGVVTDSGHVCRRRNP